MSPDTDPTRDTDSSSLDRLADDGCPHPGPGEAPPNWWVKVYHLNWSFYGFWLGLVGFLTTIGVVHFHRHPVPVTVRLETPPSEIRIAEAAPPAAEARNRSLGHRHFAKLAREKLSQEFQRNGLKLWGGDATPIPKAKADAAAEQLDDDVIHAAGQEHAAGFYTALGDGAILGKIVAAFKWLKDHPDVWIPILLRLGLLAAPFL